MLLNEHFNEALKFYNKSLEYLSEFDPDFYSEVKYLQQSVLLSLASTYHSLGHLDLVIMYCSQCLELDSLNDLAYHKRAQVFALLGNLSEARADL